mmetsp:Transcript_15921/g.44625  ORF Transcript_15921/g.44625 Transcript_15921/m.44625 type:complete len:214 (+) Transcript_15921:258-899(+)
MCIETRSSSSWPRTDRSPLSLWLLLLLRPPFCRPLYLIFRMHRSDARMSSLCRDWPTFSDISKASLSSIVSWSPFTKCSMHLAAMRAARGCFSASRRSRSSVVRSSDRTNSGTLPVDLSACDRTPSDVIRRFMATSSSACGRERMYCRTLAPTSLVSRMSSCPTARAVCGPILAGSTSDDSVCMPSTWSSCALKLRILEIMTSDDDFDVGGGT